MKALQVTCIVGAVTLIGIIYLVGGNRPVATVPAAMPEVSVNAETPTLSAAAPEATTGPGTVLGAELGSVAGPVSGPLMARGEINYSFETRSVDLGHHDAVQPVPRGEASDAASNLVPVKQDFQYLIYYVWSELPPAEKPADIVLSSLKDTPIGTPVEEIKR